MAKILVPTIMRKNVGGNATVEVAGTTVSAVLATLINNYPAVKAQLLNDEGHVRPFINVFVNGEDIRGLAGEATAVTERDEVQVIPAMAGGSC